MIKIFFSYINQVSVVFLLLTFIIIWIRKLFSKAHYDLETLLSSAFTAATIPTGIALVLCAFDKTLVTHLQDINVHLSVAGAVLLFIALRTVSKEW
jgi:hypothetical protein